MNDYELYVTTRSRLEKVWREAERRARLFDMAADQETELSRAAGGRV